MWCLVLCLLLSLSLGHEVERGCAEWRLDRHESSQVCCERCKPGNHLVCECGSDVNTLCTPCVNGTFAASSLSRVCARCTQCIAPQRVKRPCTATTDTVCDCTSGFVCKDETCAVCVRQCGKGQEPTEDNGCRLCPAGTFNNQMHHKCRNWSSSCPSPNQHIVASGTSESDIVCSDLRLTSPAPAHVPHSKDSGMALVIAVICTCLIISSALPLCVYLRKEKAVKMPPGPVEPAAGRRLVPEPEQCSFCFPQEERGSHSSLLADNKPFELVV